MTAVAALPAWAEPDLVGDHVPDLETWRCRRCPDGPDYPCPGARAHLADRVGSSPMAGMVWLQWCHRQARTCVSDGGDGKVLRARFIGWYERRCRELWDRLGNRPAKHRWGI